MKGHLEKRGKDTWRLKVYSHTDSKGQHYKTKTVKCATRKEADDELRIFIDELGSSRTTNTRTLKVDQYLKRWQRWRKSQVSESTLETQQRIIRLHIDPNIGHRKLTSLTTLDIELLYSDLGLCLSDKTIGSIHALINKALKKAVVWKLIRINPAAAVELKRAEQPDLVLPTQEQINAAIKCANPVIGLSIMLLAGSGIRRGELLGLRWEDVHLEDGYIDIKRNLQYVNKRLMVNPPKTKKSRRKVTLPAPLTGALKRYRQWQLKERLRRGVRSAEDLLIHNRHGQPFKPTTFSAAVKDAGQRAGILLGPHLLRHYHATLLLGEKINIRVLQERLGHADVNTTLNVYSHVLKAMEDEAAEASEKAVCWECTWE